MSKSLSLHRFGRGSATGLRSSSPPGRRSTSPRAGSRTTTPFLATGRWCSVFVGAAAREHLQDLSKRLPMAELARMGMLVQIRNCSRSGCPGRSVAGRGSGPCLSDANACCSAPCTGMSAALGQPVRSTRTANAGFRSSRPDINANPELARFLLDLRARLAPRDGWQPFRRLGKPVRR